MNPLKVESILEMANVLADQNDFHEILRIITEKALELFKAETTLIMMINPRTRETIKTVYKETRDQEKERYQFIHIYLCGWVITHNSGFYSENIQEDERFKKEVSKKMDLKTAMCTPLRIEGVIIGTLLVLNQTENHSFYKDDYECLEKFTAVSSPFLRNVQRTEAYFSQKIPEGTLLVKYKACGLLGKSKSFVDLLRAIEAAAKCDVRITLEGESGTGKELIAKAIHHCSSRSSSNKFIAIDCGAIPSNLIESELFGHIKGAFTGAITSRTGLLEEADGGVLFMDEIANLPLELQSKLLRVLQEGEIRPLGSNETRKIDVRIIVATSSSLRQLVANKQFREDLFYRLYVYPISVPSLAERKEDIPMLANYFLKKISYKQKKKAEIFQEDLLNFLKHREWPGNIRELENFIERIVTLADTEVRVLDLGILPCEFHKELNEIKISNKEETLYKTLREILADREKEVIEKVLNDCDWNQSKAARILGISEHAMRYKIDKLKIVKLA